jgi:DNA polymerase III subunit delta'
MGIHDRQEDFSPTPSFSALSGQEKAKNLLGRALVSGQLAHAYLFRGPDGVGKQLFARSLAAAVNCRQRQGMDACGQCPSCRRYSSGNHPDFVVISPEKGTIKIDRIREMTQMLSYPPYESGSRVILLEDIHTMRQEAANSLLKTLEEPPENNLLILTATVSHEVLTTIRSRCQMIPFFSLSQEETGKILMREYPELDMETARLLARLSEGCPGQALVMYRSEMIATWRQVVALVSDPAHASSRDVGLLLQAAETMAALKEDLLSLFGLLRIWLRDLLVAGSVGGDGRATVGLNLAVQEGWSGKAWNSSQLFAKLHAVDRAEQELGRNCNRSLVCEVLLFQLQQ